MGEKNLVLTRRWEAGENPRAPERGPAYSSDCQATGGRPTDSLKLPCLAEAVVEARTGSIVLPSPIDRAALYREFEPLVRRLIRQYGDCHELRQDLAGEIYCRFDSLLDAYDPGRGVPLKPYLVRQLTASVYTFARHQWRRQRREVSLESSAGVYEVSDCPDPSRHWDHEMAMQKVLSALPEGIAGLPQRQRQVLVWRYYEGRSFEEIANALNIQLATARSILRHSLNNLRKWLAREQLSV